MAAKWEEFMEDGDCYNLQYRTANDGKVRPEHAAMHGITLPASYPFWEEFYPPNGWNCRCNVVQVRKSKYPATDHDEAMALGELATGKDFKAIFRFNPGKEQKSIPDYNPYTIRKCRDCDIAKGKLKLAFVPDNELCAACEILRQLQQQISNKQPTGEEFKNLNQKVIQWADSNLDIIELPNAPTNNNPTKRTYLSSMDNHSIAVGKVFFSEMMHKNKRNPQLPDLVEAAMHFKEWIPISSIINIEEGKHHAFNFSVYRVVWNWWTIEFKYKLTDGELLYNMRFI